MKVGVACTTRRRIRERSTADIEHEGRRDAGHESSVRHLMQIPGARRPTAAADVPPSQRGPILNASDHDVRTVMVVDVTPQADDHVVRNLAPERRA